MKHLFEYSIGDTFYIGQNEFIVLNDYGGVGGRYAVIAKNFYDQDTIFGETNNWENSPIRNELLVRYCSEELERYISPHNIIPMVRPLRSLDGLNDYNECIDRVSLLTAFEYATYHEVLGLNSDYPSLWWLITPTSTPSNGYSHSVCCVDSCGILGWGDCGYSRGVRPFFNLESYTLVSNEPWDTTDESQILNNNVGDIEIDITEFEKGLKNLMGGDFIDDIS